MNILFVNPNYADCRSRDAMEPLAFAILARCTPKIHSITFQDERLEPIDFTLNPDLVALSVSTFTAKRAYTIAATFRRNGCRVVMGGFHPTLMPDEAIEHCDAVVIGDAEPVWESLLDDLQNGKLQRFYKSDATSPLSQQAPDRTIFSGKKYSFVKPIQFGRGCRFSCDFCSVHAFYGKGVRQKSTDSVIDEIKKLDSNYLLFVDDNLLGNYQKVKELLHALAPLRKKWICQISIDASHNVELLELMSSSGCVAVFVGFESLEYNNLTLIGKQENIKCINYADAIARFKRYGIMVCGSFVFGYENDTVKTVERACSFAIQQKLCIAHFNLLFPTPGTRLFRRLELNQTLRFKKWWLDDDYRYGECTFNPVSIHHETLANACKSSRKHFDSYKSIFKRCLDRQSNARTLSSLLLFLTANILSKKEIKVKLGRKLG